MFDGILQRHIQLVSNYYQKNKESILEMRNGFRQTDEQFDPVAEQKTNDVIAVELKNDGNVAFKLGDYDQAQLCYTKMLAKAVQGPLAAIAYANRYCNK